MIGIATKISAVVVAVAAATASHAATITIEFTGVVSGLDFPQVVDDGEVAALSVLDDFVPDLMFGDDVSGRIVIDDAADAAFVAEGSFASYTPIGGLFDITLGSRNYRSGMVTVGVVNDDPFDGDVVRVQGFSPIGPDFVGSEPGRVQFALGSMLGNLIDGVDHPDAAGLRAFVDANDIGGSQNLVSFGSPLGPGGTYRYDLTSVEISTPDVAQVPLPASMMLLGGALAAFGMLRRTRG